MGSQGNQLLLLTKFLYVWSFIFGGDNEDNYWFLSILLFLGSALVFSTFVSYRPYF